MAEDTRYEAKTGIAQISTANSNLDGTGTIATVLTANSNGTLIKSVLIKATGDTSKGMIRFFIYDGTNTRLFFEVEVPEINQDSADTKSFETQVILDFKLEVEYQLRVSTENADTFNVFAEGMDWSYYAPRVQADMTELVAANGIVEISTANSNLDGSGTLGTLITAGTSATYKGMSLRSITVKAESKPGTGMIRFFINDGETSYLFTELYVPDHGRSGVDESYERTVTFDDQLDIQSNYLVKVSTQAADIFDVSCDATNWNYA